MTNQARMLAAMRGETQREIPWAPRMDLWYTAQIERGTLPERFVGANAAEISIILGTACHSVSADFTVPREPGSLALRGLGFDNHPHYPYTVRSNQTVEYKHVDGVHSTVIETSRGGVTFRFKQTAEMRKEGISLPFYLDYPIHTVDDLEPVAEVFEHLEVEAEYAQYLRYQARIEETGVAVARGCVAASPMHLLLHELVAMDGFFYLYHDYPEKVREFCRRLEPFFHAILDAVVDCDADAVAWGSNFDRDLTWPPFFEREILPWLKLVSERLHSVGKIMVCHTDGENHGLLDLYKRCGFDVAESTCPSPMTSLSLTELRRGMGEDICVWGGVPSIVLLPSSFDDVMFARFLEELPRAAGELTGAGPCILGVSDNVPPNADLDRLDAITRVLS